MRTEAFCEIDPFCQRVLARHWPGVPIHDDIRTLSGADVGSIDVICGGFPCQDISSAGKGAGIHGERSSLWFEYARLIGEIRPRYVIVENVAALLARGLDAVLGELAALGYDAEWHCIPASAVGARHRRDRIWVVAYPDRGGCQVERQPQHSKQQGAPRCEPDRLGTSRRWPRSALTHTNGTRSPQWGQAKPQARDGTSQWGQQAHTELKRCDGAWWQTEPAVGVLADGVPNRVAGLRALGNAVVPQVVEIIGRSIILMNR